MKAETSRFLRRRIPSWASEDFKVRRSLDHKLKLKPQRTCTLLTVSSVDNGGIWAADVRDGGSRHCCRVPVTKQNVQQICLISETRFHIRRPLNTLPHFWNQVEWARRVLADDTANSFRPSEAGSDGLGATSSAAIVEK